MINYVILMYISNITKKIKYCLKLSETFNFTNNEEIQVSLEMVRNLKKLNKQLLTNAESKNIKVKKNIIRNKHSIIKLTKLYYQITNQYKFKKQLIWINWLSLKTNIALNIQILYPQKNVNLVTNTLYNDLKKILSIKKFKPKSTAFYILEAPPSYSQSNIKNYLSDVYNLVKLKKTNNIIIPSKCIFTNQISNNQEVIKCITKIIPHLNGALIFDIYSQTQFKQSLTLIQTLFSLKNNGKEINLGLSLHTNSKLCIKNIHNLLEKLTPYQKKRFILRITKGVHWVSDEYNESFYDEKLIYQQSETVKMNGIYKWSIYTIFNLIRKHQIKCHIISHNLYDIGWSLLLRKRLNVEGNVYYETDIIKFPNLSKLLYIITNSCIHTETFLLNKCSQSNIKFILRKLLNQSNKYERINKNKFGAEKTFIKSHKTFFKFLQNNYLKKNLTDPHPTIKKEVNNHSASNKNSICISDHSVKKDIIKSIQNSLNKPFRINKTKYIYKDDQNHNHDKVTWTNNSEIDICFLYSLDTYKLNKWIKNVPAKITLINYMGTHSKKKLDVYKIYRELFEVIKYELIKWKHNNNYKIKWKSLITVKKYCYIMRTLDVTKPIAVNEKFTKKYQHNLKNINIRYRYTSKNIKSIHIINDIIKNLNIKLLIVDYSLGGIYSEDIFEFNKLIKKIEDSSLNCYYN